MGQKRVVAFLDDAPTAFLSGMVTQKLSVDVRGCKIEHFQCEPIGSKSTSVPLVKPHAISTSRTRTGIDLKLSPYEVANNGGLDIISMKVNATCTSLQESWRVRVISMVALLQRKHTISFDIPTSLCNATDMSLAVRACNVLGCR